MPRCIGRPDACQRDLAFEPLPLPFEPRERPADTREILLGQERELQPAGRSFWRHRPGGLRAQGAPDQGTPLTERVFELPPELGWVQDPCA